MKELYLKIKNFRIRLNHPYFWPAFTAVLGVAIPFLFLNVIIRINKEIPKGVVGHHQDTVYVKVVNVGTLPFGALEKAQYSRPDTVSRSFDSVNFNRGVSSGLKNFNKAAVKTVKLNVVRATYKRNRSWLIWLIPFILVGLWVVRNLLVKLNPYYEKEKDPEELKKLLRSHSDQVSALGTPRKIKRFTNNLRFQYYILNSKKVVTGQNADLFIRLLLYIEKTDLIPKLSSDIEIKDTTFDIFRKSVTITVPNKEELLLRELYILNRGNLV